MLSLLHKIIKFNTITILGIIKSDVTIYHGLLVRKKRNKIEILSSFTHNSFEDLINEKIKTPVLLVADGRGILHKRIDFANEADLTWKKNINYNEIYHTSYFTENSEFISFSRKQSIDEILKVLTEKKIEVIDFYIGPLLSALLQASLEKEEIILDGIKLEFTNGQLSEIHKDSVLTLPQYKINETHLTAAQLPLYGSAINYFAPQDNIKKNTGSSINTEEIVFKKAFKFLGIAMLSLFLTSLLASYIFIQYYSRQNMQLNQDNVYSKETYNHILKLEKQKEQKIKILNETGQLSKNFLTYYAYSILKSIPEQIRINNFDIFPLLNEVKEHQQVSINSNTILIKGYTASEESFNDWLNEMKKIKWIRKFEVLSLKQDKKNFHQFEIKIMISDV